MAEKSVSLENEWTFGPDVPTSDFFQRRDVRDESGREWLLNDLIYVLERGDFKRWEAVVCQGLSLPLTERQRQAVGELPDFNDGPEDDLILDIDGIARPAQLWHEVVRTIASHLPVDHYRTDTMHYAVTADGWKELVAALGRHGKGLSLPEGAEHPSDVVPAGLRHRLWLQTCLGHLGGLGQEAELTLLHPEEHYRIEESLDCLREHGESVESLDLTLEKLLRVLVLPPRAEPIFVKMMRKGLALATTQAKIAERL